MEILEILQIIIAIYGLAVMISKATPTKKDDNFLQKFRKVFQFIENIIPDVGAKKK